MVDDQGQNSHREKDFKIYALLTNKISFFQHYYFILINICPFLDMPYWKHLEPINHVFFSQVSHTTV